MGFFTDFATGFLSADADIRSSRAKHLQDIDKIKQEKLASVSAEEELYDYKKRKDLEAIKDKADLLKQVNPFKSINQTPDAITNAPKTNPALNPVSPYGAMGVDDNAQPFPASSPIADVGQAPVTVQPSMETPAQPVMLTGAQEEIRPEVIAEVTKPQYDATKDPEAMKAAEAAYAAEFMKPEGNTISAQAAAEKALTEYKKNTPQYRAELARLEAQAKEQGEMDAKNQGIKVLKAEAAVKRSGGTVAPPASYFNMSPDLRDKMAMEDEKFLKDWSAGQSELGKQYLNAKSQQQLLMQIAQVQPDVETGGLIWGNSYLNDLRTRFDPDADVFKALSSQVQLAEAKKLYPVSNTDMQFLIKMSPNLEGTEEGNMAKVQVMSLLNEAKVDQFNFFAQYQEKWGTLKGVEAAFDKYMKQNPLLDSEASEGINFVANEDRQPIDDFLNGKTSESKEDMPEEKMTSAITISTEEEYRKLPKGTEYIDPNGKTRVKQ